MLRSVTNAYAKSLGITLVPDYEVDNLAMAISLVVSTGGVALMPLYSRNLLPPTVISRPLHGEQLMIDVTLGYRRDDTPPQLATIVQQVKRLHAGAE